MFILYRQTNQEADQQLDYSADTAFDYTIKIKNYPNPGRGIDIDEDIKEFLEAKGYKVKKINLVYKLDDFYELEAEK